MATHTVSAPAAKTAPNPLPATADCLHCKLPFRPTPQRPEFCCSGCQFVYRLINQNGLENYYDLQEGRAQPIKPTVFQARDYSWLAELTAEAEQEMPTPGLTLDLQGISCVGCVWLIEELFQRREGGLSIQINSALGQVRLNWTAGSFDAIAFARELQSFGYLLAPAAKRENRESRQLVRRMGVAGALFMNCMLFTLPFYLGMDPSFEYAPLFGVLIFLFATTSVAVGGSYFLRRSWHALRRRIIHIDLPISVGIVLAYSGSIYAWLQGDHRFLYFDFVSMFIFLMLVGRWVQQIAIERNRNYLLGMRNQQQQVRLVTADGDKNRKLEITQVVDGMRYVVAPGQFVPVCSDLLSDEATVGLDWINGESDAHHHRRGSRVLAGAINLSGKEVHLQARENWQDSLLSSLLAHDPKDAPRNLFVERLIKNYLCAVLMIAGLGGAAWFWGTGNALVALQVLISVLVVSCPCAIGVAWPLADELAVSALRQRGVFIRDQSLWHRLGKVRKIIFDKTGTLTMENLALRNSEVLQSLDETARGLLLHLAESNLHPVSRCLREHLLAEGFDRKPANPANLKVREVIGFGLEAETEAGIWRLGRPGWETPYDDRSIPGENRDCQFSLNGRVLAAFSLGEEIRPDAADEIALWREQGYEIYILSGDRREKVKAMAATLNLPAENCLGEMSPGEKADWVEKVDCQDTMMIGDGANDSLAFDKTWCRGTPAVDRGLLEEKADFYFLGRGLNGIRNLFETAANRRRILRRVFIFTSFYNLGAVSLCLAGMMNPLLAAIVMPLSSVASISSVVVQTKWKERRSSARRAPASLLPVTAR